MDTIYVGLKDPIDKVPTGISNQHAYVMKDLGLQTQKEQLKWSFHD